MLWEEIRNGNSSTIQNAMRRILEYYFKILGGIDPEEICGRFAGQERLVCYALFSWVNAGSHSAFEDAAMSRDGSTAGLYLRVFKDIFEKSGHPNHYHMMMASSPNDTSNDEAVAAIAPEAGAHTK
jgi:wobble nucleotide-excising tRNase